MQFLALMEIFKHSILKIQIVKEIKDLIIHQKSLLNHGINRNNKEKVIVIEINFLSTKDMVLKKEDRMILLIIHIKILTKIVHNLIILQIFLEH
jgi:hypothetical protein